MSGPLVAFISDSIHLGLGDIWGAGGSDYVCAFRQQSHMTPAAFATFMDNHVMNYAVRGEQMYLAEYPERRLA